MTTATGERTTERPVTGATAVRDSLFLCGIVALACCLYLFDLGFYSDDWAFWGSAAASPDQSYFGVLEGIVGDSIGMRPIQFLYLTALYKTFGLDPTGYHVANLIAFQAGIVLFYLVLRKLDQPRHLTVAVALIYALLPHYNSDLMWVAAFQAVLSMTFYFLSLLADLIAAESKGNRLWRWKALAVSSMLVSVLAYEVFLPLFLLNCVVVWTRIRRSPTTAWSMRRHAVFFGGHLLALASAAVYKSLSTSRMAADDNLSYHLRWFYRLIEESLGISYLEYGLGYPVRMWRIAQRYFDWKIALLGIAIGAVVFMYLYRTADETPLEDPSAARSRAALLIAVGTVVFLGGYAIFLTNYNAIATPTGIANRIAIAAAVGVALTYAGAVSLVGSWLTSPRWRAACFGLFTALLCTSGVMINNTVAGFWITAYERENVIVDELVGHFGDLPEGVTVLLDRVCPYVGPAIVFESSWDLRGALMTRYETRDIRANVIRPHTRIEQDAIVTELYGRPVRYPYTGDIRIYNAERGESHRIRDAAAARRYFQTYNPEQNGGCPESEDGIGVRIF